jgi:hypothetical protein
LDGLKLMHPLVDNLSALKDADIENKIQDLTRKYFMSNNFDLQQQIGMVLNSYKEEMANRQRIAYEKMMQTRNKDLDKLINVN